MKGKKHKKVLILMIVSQLLLTVFVLQWLRSQYRDEKERLAEELTMLYIDTQDEIVDTLLFRSYVNPVLSGDSIRQEIRISKDSMYNDSVHFSVPHDMQGFARWKGNRAELTVRLNHGKDSAGSLSDTNKFRKINDEMLLRSVKLIVSHTRDSMDLEGPHLRNLQINPDTAVFKRHFHNRITDSGMKISLLWDGEPASTVKSGNNEFHLNPVNPFSLPAVTVTRYNGYLLAKILPQSVFGLILIFITALAFVISYRSLRDHIVLNSLRNEFISNMTHELKTPVATISIALESLGKYNMRKDPELMEEYLRLVSSETRRIEELINRVLDQSLLEENIRLLKPVFTDVNVLISEVVAIMNIRLENAGIIEFRPSAEAINVMCDPLFLKGVILNLIDNSIKYCDKSPAIKILSRSEKRRAIVEVIDNGPGIPEEYHEKIFEKFFRLPSGNVHNVKGYGLGLSFAALVMKLHKGSIDVRNIDGGCSFTIKMPEI